MAGWERSQPAIVCPERSAGRLTRDAGMDGGANLAW